MKRYIAYIILALALSSAANAFGQQSGHIEPFRTRLVPYSTAVDASKKSMDKQLYMQPIEEWFEFKGALRGEFIYPFSWVERRFFLRIESVNAPYEVYVNGTCAGSTYNGFAPAEFDITKLAREDKNKVEIRYLSDEGVKAIECFERGESKPVAYIISQPRVRVRDVEWTPSIGVGGVVNAEFCVVMHNEMLNPKSARLYYELFTADSVRLATGHRDVKLGMRGIDTLRFGVPLTEDMLWSAEHPTQLTLRLRNRMEGRDLEFYDLPVSLREVEYKDGAYSINNNTVDIAWEEMSPLVSLADVEAAHERGVRAIRFAEGCVSDQILYYCDRQGIYVAITAPINSSASGSSRKRGGNPSNDPTWRNTYVERATQMIHTTKRHASVIAYYLANESANGICLYESYIAAKRIAGDRPVFYSTGGNEWNSDGNR